MSDMEKTDVTDAADAPAEPTAEELQAEIATLQAEVAAQEAKDSAAEAPPEPQPAPEPVPVFAQQPSSAKAQPEAAPAADEPLSLEDAARVLITLLRGHRTVGDSDVDAAISDIEAALPAQA